MTNSMRLNPPVLLCKIMIHSKKSILEYCPLLTCGDLNRAEPADYDRRCVILSKSDIIYLGTKAYFQLFYPTGL